MKQKASVQKMETPSSTVERLVMGAPSLEEGNSVAAGVELDTLSSTISKVVVEAPPLTDPGLAGKLTNVLPAEAVETALGPKTSKLGKEILVRTPFPETAKSGMEISSVTPLPIDMVLPETSKPERELSLASPTPETCKPRMETSSTVHIPETCKPGLESSLVTPLPETSNTGFPLPAIANPGTETPSTALLSETSKSRSETPVISLPETLKSGMEISSGSTFEVVEDNAPPTSLETTLQTTAEVTQFPVPAKQKAVKAPESGMEAPPSTVPGTVVNITPPVSLEREVISTSIASHFPLSSVELDVAPSVAFEHLAVGSAPYEVSSLKTLPGPSAQSHLVDMAEHTQSVSLIEPLPSDTEGLTPQPSGSVDSILALAYTQQMQVASCPVTSESSLEPIASANIVAKSSDKACLSAATVATDVLSTHSSLSATPNFAKQQLLNIGSIPQQATSNMIADTSLSMGCRTSNSFLPGEATKVINKGSSWLNETSSFPSVASTFADNMVSSVEGETVLIVENLSLKSQTPWKADGILPGIVGNSKVSDQQNEADMKANLENMHAEGNDLVGRKIRKKFGRKFFEGEVVEYDSELNWYKVVYEDGDEEELDAREVKRMLLLDEVEEDQRSAKKRHRRSSSISNSLRRSTIKAKRFGSPRFMLKDGDQAASGDALEDDIQLQERIKLRGLKKRLVIDTSNDGNADSFDSDIQPSASSDRASDDNHEPAVERQSNSTKKLRRKSRSNKRRKFDDKSDGEKDFIASQPRLSSRRKDEPPLKSQETPTEHRIATRSSTGSLNTHMTSSDGHTSPRFKKGHEDFQDKLRPESPALELLSPLVGGAKLIGRKTRKDFGGQLYIGEIVNYDNRVKYYKVRYEDGDEEELEWSELESTLLPQEEHQQVLALEAPYQVVSRLSKGRLKEHSRRVSTPKSRQGAIILYEDGASNGDLPSSARRWRKKIRTASVSVMMKGMDDWTAASTTPMAASQPPPRPLATARFASASDADVFEYFGWGEVVNFERSRCPELRATRLLPTSSPVVHLAASRHHLAALTAAGQVWVWRCKHANVHTRCNEWEHVSVLDNRKVILVDISGPDVDRTSAGYQAEQEDQVPDPFYLAAVCSNGDDIILQGSQPHESVHTYRYDDEPQHPGLRDAVFQSNPGYLEDVGKIVQVSVGMVEAADESPFVGYITDADSVYIRSATRDYMEEVNLVTGYTGKPVKIQCGRVYHAIIMTDDGRAWTWGQGYYPGSNLISAGFASKWSSPFSVCQPAVGTLVGRKVVDVGCYGEDFIALTNDGDVHQWTHALPNPAAGVYNVPATPVYGQGPSIASGDKLKQVTIGAGICAGISECGKVHTWRTSMKGGFVGIVGSEREALTPLGRDEGYKETVILSLGARIATKVMCVAGSLLVVVKRKTRGRRGGKRKSDASLKGKSAEDKVTTG